MLLVSEATDWLPEKGSPMTRLRGGYWKGKLSSEAIKFKYVVKQDDCFLWEAGPNRVSKVGVLLDFWQMQGFSSAKAFLECAHPLFCSDNACPSVVFVGVNGVNGNQNGQLGPSNLYARIGRDSRFLERDIWVWCVDTLQAESREHVFAHSGPILDDALEILSVVFCNVKVVLLGWSMGSSTVTQAGYLHKERVQGIVILAGQPAQLKADWITTNKVPVLVFAGGLDSVFKLSIAESVAERLNGKLVVMNDGDHCFSKCVDCVVSEIHVAMKTVFS